MMSGERKMDIECIFVSLCNKFFLTFCLCLVGSPFSKGYNLPDNVILDYANNFACPQVYIQESFTF